MLFFEMSLRKCQVLKFIGAAVKYSMCKAFITSRFPPILHHFTAKYSGHNFGGTFLGVIDVLYLPEMPIPTLGLRTFDFRVHFSLALVSQDKNQGKSVQYCCVLAKYFSSTIHSLGGTENFPHLFTQMFENRTGPRATPIY